LAVLYHEWFIIEKAEVFEGWAKNFWDNTNAPLTGPKARPGKRCKRGSASFAAWTNWRQSLRICVPRLCLVTSRINHNQQLINPAVSPIHRENHARKSAKRAGLLRTRRQSI
jgi:hypothetical protein